MSPIVKPLPRHHFAIRRDIVRDPCRERHAFDLCLMIGIRPREKQTPGHILRCRFGLYISIGLPFIQVRRHNPGWSAGAYSSYRWTGHVPTDVYIDRGHFVFDIWGWNG